VQALTATAQSFMMDLPDMVLTMDDLSGRVPTAVECRESVTHGPGEFWE
jgi:hypothetical protein